MIFANEEEEKKQIEELKAKEEEELVKFLAQTKYKVPYINLTQGVIIENEALRLISEKEAREWQAAPFRLMGKNVYVGVRNPQLEETQKALKIIEERGYKPIIFMVSSKSLKRVWDRYQEISQAVTTRVGGLDIASDVLLEIGGKIKSIKDISNLLEEEIKKITITSRLLEVIIGGAISLNASDIHLEAIENGCRIRFRLDGILYDVGFLNSKIFRLISSRIKLLSGMKLTITHTAQDGRFSIFLEGTEINIRNSTVPGFYGESFVMRILNPKAIKVNIEELGIPDPLLKILDQEIKRPHGFILVTGPTGSGKTTTLYAFLRRIYSPEIKIITIEDPIEYKLEGITQTQVDLKKKFTFLAGLRAALRQDPEVIMVGEVRDHETAEIAVNASLTGHMVFSTLHTNTAAGVIPRLLDLKVSPKILPSALTVSMAQRLVRCLCPYCKKEREPTKEEKNDIQEILKNAEEAGKNLKMYGISQYDNFSLYDPVGCEKCNFIGYKGRIGVFEVILTTEDIEKLIVQTPSEREIKRAARKQGILDMREDGVVKIIKGITSLEEVKSVVDFYER